MSLAMKTAAVAAVSALMAGQIAGAADGDAFAKAQVASSFEAKFSATGAEVKRLEELEESMRATFVALPKNSHGNLAESAVRAALHRHFMRRNGWYVIGLGPDSAQSRSTPPFWSSEERESQQAHEWVPPYLQQQLFKRKGGANGAKLRDIAALAATMEDLVNQETSQQVENLYHFFRLPKADPVSLPLAKVLVRAYFVSVMKEGRFSVQGLQESRSPDLKNLSDSDDGWDVGTEEDEDKAWLDQFEAEHNKVLPASKTRTFDDIVQLIIKIGQVYHSRFEDTQCQDLKATLKAMKGYKAGRVDLSGFHDTALASHFAFTEDADYLRSIAALDESKSNASVVVPSYVIAWPNCMIVSNRHAICCHDACESLLLHLEQKLAGPAAPSKRIAELLKGLPSNMALGSPAAGSVEKLGKVAEASGGEVLIHSRAFGVWMHEAFPDSCPKPREEMSLEDDETCPSDGSGPESCRR